MALARLLPILRSLDSTLPRSESYTTPMATNGGSQPQSGSGTAALQQLQVRDHTQDALHVCLVPPSALDGNPELPALPPPPPDRRRPPPSIAAGGAAATQGPSARPAPQEEHARPVTLSALPYHSERRGVRPTGSGAIRCAVVPAAAAPRPWRAGRWCGSKRLGRRISQAAWCRSSGAAGGGEPGAAAAAARRHGWGASQVVGGVQPRCALPTRCRTA